MDLVLTYSDAQDIWDKLVIVYEQSSNQRLSLLVMEFFKVQSNPEMAKVEKLFSDMNTELRQRGSCNILIELLHVQILATQDLSTRRLAISGSCLMTTSEQRTVCLRNFVRLKNGCRHRRQQQSQVHLWHMHQP